MGVDLHSRGRARRGGWVGALADERRSALSGVAGLGGSRIPSSEYGESMASPAMQKADLDAVTPDLHGLISKQTAHLEGVDVTRVRFDPGARWSKDLKSYAGTESCELPHVGLVLGGRLHVVMDDGSEEEFGPNEVMMLPPGHDAWSIGDQACVFVEFSRGNDYYA
jgi:hypothetical protein